MLMTDIEMRYIQNVLHDLREERRKLLDWETDADEHSHTTEQIQLLVQQLVNIILPRYAWERMKHIDARRNLKGALSESNRSLGNKSLNGMEEKAAKRKKSIEIDFEQRREEFGAEKLPVQQQQEKIAAVTPRDRRRAVILEEKVDGQTSTAVAFWSKLKKVDFQREAIAAFPLISAMCWPECCLRDPAISNSRPLESRWRPPATSLWHLKWSPPTGPSSMIESPRRTVTIEQGHPTRKEALKMLVSSFFGRNEKEHHVTLTNGSEWAYHGRFCQYCELVHAGGVVCFLDKDDRNKLMPYVLLCTSQKEKAPLIQKAAVQRQPDGGGGS